MTLMSRRRVSVLGGVIALAVLLGQALPELAAQPESSGIADLAGIWDGGGRVRPVNGRNMPWYREMKEGALLPDGTKAGPNHPPNFPELNERALAYVQVFDEALAPKYDCQPSTPPALPYDPYMMEIVQWPDRVLIRYEKDDQLRTVWLDGRQPTARDYALQGFSVGRYENDALIVETSHFVFDITGFDDYNGIPSSQLKRVRERYWREGDVLKATITVEDPLFLRKPTSFTTRWLAAPRGYKLQPWDCDPEGARAAVRFLPPKYR